MKAVCLIDDRKVLVKAIEDRLEEKAKYLGAPTFKFIVGPYTIEKDGTLTAADEDVDRDLIASLISREIIEAEDAGKGSVSIALPIEQYDGRSLMNIVFRLNSKDLLFSKVAGLKGAFKIDREFVLRLDKKRPETTEDFMKILKAHGGNEINKGLIITDEQIIFSGFPFTKDAAEINAYMRLVELMGKEAIRTHRIRPDRVGLPENEKYAFRNWLVAIGMRGDEYKAARSVLLKNLSGHTAYRTKRQAEAASIKWAEIRRERKEEACPTFHVL